jgi:hypothetical protein
MQKGPTTDRGVNVLVVDNKFRDIRQKAVEDYIQRKSRRDKKEKDIKVPDYKIGDHVMLVKDGFVKTSKRFYCLVEIVDFFYDGWRFIYYAEVLKSTDKDNNYKIGRLTHFEDHRGYTFGLKPINIPVDSIKWPE